MEKLKWPPISYGTTVRTTQENPVTVKDFLPEALLSRRWGVIGKVIKHHDSHGLCYEVKHSDGSIGFYDPTEIEVI